MDQFAELLQRNNESNIIDQTELQQLITQATLV